MRQEVVNRRAITGVQFGRERTGRACPLCPSIMLRIVAVTRPALDLSPVLGRVCHIRAAEFRPLTRCRAEVLRLNFGAQTCTGIEFPHRKKSRIDIPWGEREDGLIPEPLRPSFGVT